MSTAHPFPANPSSPSPASARLLDQVRDRIRYRHYSRRTEISYVQWIRRYVLYHGKRHPRELTDSHEVCTHCGYHFRIGSQARFKMLFDGGERDLHRLTVCGLTYLRELDGRNDPVKAGFTGL